MGRRASETLDIRAARCRTWLRPYDDALRRASELIAELVVRDVDELAASALWPLGAHEDGQPLGRVLAPASTRVLLVEVGSVPPGTLLREVQSYMQVSLWLRAQTVLVGGEECMSLSADIAADAGGRGCGGDDDSVGRPGRAGWGSGGCDGRLCTAAMGVPGVTRCAGVRRHQLRTAAAVCGAGGLTGAGVGGCERGRRGGSHDRRSTFVHRAGSARHLIPHCVVVAGASTTGVKFHLNIVSSCTERDVLKLCGCRPLHSGQWLPATVLQLHRQRVHYLPPEPQCCVAR